MEPLKELAMFAYYWAPVLCKSKECKIYHKNWSLIRLLEGKGRQPDYPDFFVENIKKYCDKKGARLLISGCADAGILSVAYDAIKKMRHTPKITIIDKCRTPIEQNKLYAEFLDLDITHVVGDILTENLSNFDLIVAHSFLNFFPDQSLDQLFKQWYDFLCPNGVILLNNKSVDSQYDNVTRTVDLKLIGDKLQEVKKEVNRLGLPSDIIESISDFWIQGKIRKLITNDRLNGLVKNNNFAVINHEFRTALKGVAPTSLRYRSYHRNENLIILRKSA